MQLIEANWVALVMALLIGLVVAWWLFRRTAPGGRPRERRPDVLDEGAAPAQRNQALIDAPSATATAGLAATGPAILAGVGEVAAAAATEEVAAAASPPEPPAPAPTGAADDLTRIKGVGPKLNALLGQLGVTRFDQIAGWTDADIARIDAQLGAFAGRITRDSWVEQCRYLAAGDTAGFEGRFGKL